MDWIYIVLGASLIGLTLGLLGSGGSILTVPILVYLLKHPDKISIAESLAIVGGIALVGASINAKTRNIDWRSVIWFGLPGMAGTYVGAALAGLVSGSVQLAVFGGVMLAAAWRMAMPRTNTTSHRIEQTELPDANPHQRAAWKIAVNGVLVGCLTGFVGVGGGFIIVPALVLLGGLPMQLAVGTSLVIIAMNAASGLWKYTLVLGSLDQHVDWSIIAIFIAIGGVGSFVGSTVGKRLNQQLLRRLFAGFLVVMSLFIMGREVPKLMAHSAEVADEIGT